MGGARFSSAFKSKHRKLTFSESDICHPENHERLFFLTILYTESKFRSANGILAHNRHAIRSVMAMLPWQLSCQSKASSFIIK